MLPPQSMPIGFTYDGDPIYPAPPFAEGGRQPLAVLADGEPIWPAQGGLVPTGQPQPFGVLSSGAFVWAVEQRAPAPPTPWYRRRRVLVPAAALAGVLAVGVVAASGDGEGDQQAAQQAADGQAGAEEVERAAADRAAAEEQAAEEAAEQEVEPAGPRVEFVMPDFTTRNLQDAQDEVQELGVFFSLSHDLRGTRSQVLDTNWQVCTQTPAPGTPVTGDAADWEGKISFGVVKLTETCP